MNNIISTLDTYLAKKAPALPSNVKEVLVKIAPWITLIGVIFSIPAILAFLGWGALVMPTPYGFVNTGITYFLAIAFLIVTAVLRGMAIPGLFNRVKKGWMLLLYSTAVGLVYSILNFDIIGGLLGAIISLYLLFQIREYYK